MPEYRSIKLFYIHRGGPHPDPAMEALQELADQTGVEVVTETNEDEQYGEVLNTLVAKPADALAELWLAFLHFSDVDEFFSDSLEGYAEANPQARSVQNLVTLYFTTGSSRVQEGLRIINFGRIERLLRSSELTRLLEKRAPAADFKDLFRRWAAGTASLASAARTALDIRLQSACILLTSDAPVHQQARCMLEKDPWRWFTDSLDLAPIRETQTGSIVPSQASQCSSGPLEQIVSLLTQSGPPPAGARDVLLNIGLLQGAHEQITNPPETQTPEG